MAADPAPSKPGPPERLHAGHELDAFDSGRPQLDPWLRSQALRNEGAGASRTYVVCEGARVLAFYSLANGAVILGHAPGRVRRNMPDPIPVMVLGRLAVDRSWQRRGLGRALLRDAVLRVGQAAEIAGIRAILVHAKDERVRAWYQRFGFVQSPTNELTLMALLRDVDDALERA